MLSPRSLFISKGKRIKFVYCGTCQYALTKLKVTPEFANANYMEIGKVPKEIDVLNEAELAFVTDVRCHAYMFAFCGGHKGIFGWHSLIKTNLRTKRCALEAMDRIDKIPSKLFIISTGEMTPGQKV